MFECRSEFLHLQSAFLAGEGDSRRGNFTRWSEYRLAQLDILRQQTPEEQEEHFASLTPRRRNRASWWGSPKRNKKSPSPSSPALSFDGGDFVLRRHDDESPSYEEEDANVTSARVLATLEEVVTAASSFPPNASHPSTSSAASTNYSPTEWRLILATVLLEKHAQLHVDPRLLVSSGHDATFLEGAVNALAGAAFPETLLPALIRQSSPSWFEAFLVAALQYPEGQLQRMFLRIFIASVTGEIGADGTGDENAREDGLDQKYLALLYHLLLYHNALVVDEDGSPGEEDDQMFLTLIRNARNRWETRFGQLDGVKKLRLMLTLIFAVDDIVEETDAAAVASSSEASASTGTNRSPSSLFPALWRYKISLMHQQNTSLHILAQTQGGAAGSVNGFQFSLCTQQNVANHTERVSKRLRKAAKFIDGCIVDAADAQPAVADSSPVATSAFHAYSAWLWKSPSPLLTPAMAEYRHAVVDLFAVVIRMFVSHEKASFDQFSRLFHDDDNNQDEVDSRKKAKGIWRFDADFQAPYVLRLNTVAAALFSSPGAPEVDVGETPNGADLVTQLRRAVGAIESSPAMPWHCAKGDGHILNPASVKSILRRLTDFLATTQRSYLAAIEPTAAEKMTIILSAASTTASSTATAALADRRRQKLRRKYMQEAVGDADWIRRYLDFFVDNARLFTSLGFNYDLFLAFCHTASALDEDITSTNKESRSLPDAAGAIFETLPLQWKRDFLTALLAEDNHDLKIDSPSSQRSMKKRNILQFFTLSSSRDRMRFYQTSTVVFNRLVDSSETSTKEFEANLHGIANLCLRDAETTVKRLFEQILLSKEKSGVVLHIVERLPFVMRVRKRVDGNLSRHQPISSSASSSSSSSYTIFQESLLSNFHLHLKATSKEQDHFKHFVVEALASFQPRWRHDPKKPFYDVAEWMVDTLLVAPLVTPPLPATAGDSSMRVAVDLLDALLTASPRARKKWLTLVADGFGLMVGLLRIFEQGIRDDAPSVKDNEMGFDVVDRYPSSAPSSTPPIGVPSSSSPPIDSALIMSLACSIAVVLQDSSGFEWLIDFTLKNMNWPTALTFFGESATIAMATPPQAAVAVSAEEEGSTAERQEGVGVLSTHLANALEACWERAWKRLEIGGAQEHGWAILVLTSTVYIPEACPSFAWFPTSTSAPAPLTPGAFLLVFPSLFRAKFLLPSSVRRCATFLLDAADAGFIQADSTICRRRVNGVLLPDDVKDCRKQQQQQQTQQHQHDSFEKAIVTLSQSSLMCASTLIAQVVSILFAEVDVEIKRDFGKDLKTNQPNLSKRKSSVVIGSQVEEKCIEEERKFVEESRRGKASVLPTIVAVYAELLTPDVIKKRIPAADESAGDEPELAALAFHFVIMADIVRFMRQMAGVKNCDEPGESGERYTAMNYGEGREAGGMMPGVGSLNDPLFLLLLETITGAKNLMTERGRRWKKLARQRAAKVTVQSTSTSETPAESDDDSVLSAFESNVNRVIWLLLSGEQKETITALVSTA